MDVFLAGHDQKDLEPVSLSASRTTSSPGRYDCGSGECWNNIRSADYNYRGDFSLIKLSVDFLWIMTFCEICVG